MTLEKPSGCKVNLLLNILGKRADGFHELETVIHPVGVYDRMTFTRGGWGFNSPALRQAYPRTRGTWPIARRSCSCAR